MQTTPEARFLDLRRAALRYSVSVRWLRQQLRRPDRPLPHVRPGGKVLVDVVAADRWFLGFATHRDLDQLAAEAVAEVTRAHGLHA